MDESLSEIVKLASMRAQMVDLEALIRFIFPSELQVLSAADPTDLFLCSLTNSIINCVACHVNWKTAGIWLLWPP